MTLAAQVTIQEACMTDSQAPLQVVASESLRGGKTSKWARARLIQFLLSELENGEGRRSLADVEGERRSKKSHEMDLDSVLQTQPRKKEKGLMQWSGTDASKVWKRSCW